MRRIALICIFLIALATSVAQAYPARGTLMVAAGNWCQGQGVDVYSNGGDHIYYPNDKNYVGSEYTGVKWQCVELAHRLYYVRGWKPGGLWGINNAYEIWGKARELGMEQHSISSGYVPMPGDMMVFDSGLPNSANAGHVALVDRVDDSYIYVCEQNSSDTGCRSYARGSSPAHCYGFVHDPDNHLVNCTAASASWTSTPGSGWYHTDQRLVYSYGGSSPSVVESPAAGALGEIYVSEGGQGWRDYSVHVWNGCGDVTLHWQGGWDTGAPSTNFSGPATSTWLPAGSSVAWNPTDGTSGVASSSFVWDNGSTNAHIPEGVHSVTVSPTDNAGNNVTETHGPYWLDTTAPVITLTGPATSTWITTPQSVTWNAPDATSGVSTKLLTWDNGPTATASPASIPEGKRTATITATDVAGNTATPYVAGPFWIDTLAPIVTLTLNPAAPNGENGWYTVNPTLTISAVDPNGSNGSGVQDRFYSIDGSEQSYTAEVTLSDGGVHSLVGRATDVAGNSGQVALQVKLDTTAPVFAAIHTQPESGVLDTLSASWDCDDPDSGVAEYEYSIYREAGDTDELIAGPITTTKPYAQEISLALARGETYYFIVRAKNNAGLYSNYIASDAITATDGIRDVAPNFNSGGVSVPAEARRSDNYMIVDSLGQFVVDTSTGGSLVLESGYWHSEVPTVSTETVSVAKATENNKLIQLGSPTKPVVVTVAPGVFTDRFYVEQPDRSSGIAVQFGLGLGMSLVPGDRVWILGTINNVDGERVLQCAAPTWVSYDLPIGAMFISNKWLGGSDFNTLTKGADGALGLNNIGILVKTCGQVSNVDPSGAYFYINDGSNLSDGTMTAGGANVGVRVAADGRSYTSGQFVTVTGISSCFTAEDGKIKRLIRPIAVQPL